MIKAIIPAITAAVFACSLGCTGDNRDGSSYLLDEKPTGEAVGVVDLKAAIEVGAELSSPQVIIGRVGGGQVETWNPGQATFLIRDLALKIQSHDHDGNHDNCKFCQAEKAKELESMALVQLVDASGELVAADARQLLGLTEDQLIIAEGSGAVDEAGFVFTATKIYIDDESSAIDESSQEDESSAATEQSAVDTL